MQENTQDSSRRAMGEALFTLMANDEYQKITVLEICQHAGLSRRTFYRHFRTKKDVLNYMLGQLLQDFIIEFGSESLSFEEAVMGSFTYFYKHRQLLTLFLRHGQFHLVTRILEDYMRNACTQERARLMDQPGMACYFDSYMAGSLSAVLRLWVKNGFDKPPAELARFTLSLNKCAEIN